MDNSILRTIADNPLLLEAVKKAVVEEFSVEMNEDLPDEVLGQQMRARLVGIKKIEDAFQKISRLKTLPEPVEKVNGAR